jgi:hypothetical protein
MEVVMSRGRIVEEVHIKDADGQDGGELRPEHPFLKREAGHGVFSVSKIFDMEDCMTWRRCVSNIFDIACA